MSNRILLDRNIEIPMRDGTILKADLFRPDISTPVPAIVSRTPYDKNNLEIQKYIIHFVRAAEAGFAVICQDTRGRFESGGEFCPFINEGLDGYDTVEWAAAQPWCNGNVGMTGGSYIGAVQWLAAVEQPPHLKAIFPIVTASEYYEGWTYQGGAFQLGFVLFWILLYLAPDAALHLARLGKTDKGEVDRILESADIIDQLYGYLPLNDIPIMRKAKAAHYYFDWLSHYACDDYWQSIAINDKYHLVEVPAYHVGGWYDIFLHGTLENFTRLREEGGTENARKGQRLLIGPWAHGNISGLYPGCSYGIFSSADMVDLTDLQLKYFTYHLKGGNDGYNDEAPVRIFVMGENLWREENEWPLARTRYTKWFLQSSGNAAANGGTLSPKINTVSDYDAYLYDPRNPSPTAGGPSLLPGANISENAGPLDQRRVESRPDVVVYTSMLLDTPLEITGPLSVTLFASTSALDTDFAARLCDVFPDGTSLILAEGIVRARFRDGYKTASPVEPDRVYEYHINLVATSNLFLPGHRIRLDITSSSFPRFDRNTNTGNAPGIDGLEDMVPALQKIFHTKKYPSHILLPAIPG
jgi:putative CocE/NonD family hydrolase